MIPYTYTGESRQPHPGTQEIVIEIPENEWMTSNMRPHHMQRAAKTKLLRTRSATIALAQLTPIKGPVLIACQTYYRGSRPLDNDACAPSLKAIMDGFTDANIWPDDNPTHVTATLYRAPARHPELPQGWHALRITITDQEVPF